MAGAIRRANAAHSRDNEVFRAALARRDVLRDTIVAAMKEQGLTMLAYPTLRRKPAVIGETQAGSNCQVSATSACPR